MSGNGGASNSQVTEETTFPLPIISSSLPGVPHSTLQPLEMSLIWCPVLTPPYTTTGRTHVLQQISELVTSKTFFFYVWGAFDISLGAEQV